MEGQQNNTQTNEKSRITKRNNFISNSTVEPGNKHNIVNENNKKEGSMLTKLGQSVGPHETTKITVDAVRKLGLGKMKKLGKKIKLKVESLEKDKTNQNDKVKDDKTPSSIPEEHIGENMERKKRLLQKLRIPVDDKNFEGLPDRITISDENNEKFEEQNKVLTGLEIDLEGIEVNEIIKDNFKQVFELQKNNSLSMDDKNFDSFVEDINSLISYVKTKNALIEEAQKKGPSDLNKPALFESDGKLLKELAIYNLESNENYEQNNKQIKNTTEKVDAMLNRIHEAMNNFVEQKKQKDSEKQQKKNTLSTATLKSHKSKNVNSIVHNPQKRSTKDTIEAITIGANYIANEPNSGRLVVDYGNSPADKYVDNLLSDLPVNQSVIFGENELTDKDVKSDIVESKIVEQPTQTVSQSQVVMHNNDEKKGKPLFRASVNNNNNKKIGNSQLTGATLGNFFKINKKKKQEVKLLHEEEAKFDNMYKPDFNNVNKPIIMDKNDLTAQEQVQDVNIPNDNTWLHKAIVLHDNELHTKNNGRIDMKLLNKALNRLSSKKNTELNKPVIVGKNGIMTGKDGKTTETMFMDSPTYKASEGTKLRQLFEYTAQQPHLKAVHGQILDYMIGFDNDKRQLATFNPDGVKEVFNRDYIVNKFEKLIQNTNKVEVLNSRMSTYKIISKGEPQKVDVIKQQINEDVRSISKLTQEVSKNQMRILKESRRSTIRPSTGKSKKVQHTLQDLENLLYERNKQKDSSIIPVLRPSTGVKRSTDIEQKKNNNMQQSSTVDSLPRIGQSNEVGYKARYNRLSTANKMGPITDKLFNKTHNRLMNKGQVVSGLPKIGEGVKI